VGEKPAEETFEERVQLIDSIISGLNGQERHASWQSDCKKREKRKLVKKKTVRRTQESSPHKFKKKKKKKKKKKRVGLKKVENRTCFPLGGGENKSPNQAGRARLEGGKDSGSGDKEGLQRTRTASKAEKENV